MQKITICPFNFTHIWTPASNPQFVETWIYLTASSVHTWSPNSFNEIIVERVYYSQHPYKFEIFDEEKVNLARNTRAHRTNVYISTLYLHLKFSDRLNLRVRVATRNIDSNCKTKYAQVIQSRYSTRCMRKTVENWVRGTRAVRLERQIDVVALLFGYLNFIRTEQKSRASDARCKYRHRNIRHFGIVKSNVYSNKKSN